MAVRVQAEDFDTARVLDALAAGDTRAGALCLFVGRVRDVGGGGALVLEHYPGMTETHLSRLEDEARRRFDLRDCVLVHRHGRLAPTDNIVLVAVAAAHRRAAFDAATFLIDRLKTEAPFWKREEDPDGNGRWVAARNSDRIAADRWRDDDRDR